MKIKKQHRLLSLVFSLALVILVLGAGVPTSAENGADNVITGAKAYLWPNMSVSDLKNVVKAEGNDLKGSVVETTVWKNGALTDVVSNYGSDMETGWFNFALNDDYILQRKSGSSVDDVSNDVDQTDNYWSLRFKINGTLNNPKSFVLNFHRNSKDLASQHYAVFAADSIDKLESSKIIEMKASDKRCGDFFDVSGLNLTNIKYVEVRIYHRGFNQQNWGSKPIIMGQHINEIGFFGGTVNSNEGTAITEHTVISKNPSLTLGENHLVGSDMKAGFYSADKLVADCKLDSNTAANFTDGVLSNDYNLNWDVGKKYTAGYPNDAFQTDSYYQIQIELSGQLRAPERFVLIGRKDGQFMSHHYAVFASDNLNELYKASNKIIEISDSQERAGDDVSLTGFDKTVSYIGIRFYHRGYTYANTEGATLQFVNEIGFYGGSVLGPMGDMNMDTKVDILDLVRLKRYNADSTVVIDETNELLVDFEGSSAQLAALRMYLLTGNWHTPTLFADEGYTYVWGDEFNAKTLNSNKWVNAVVEKNDTVIASNETNLTLEDSSLNLRVNGEKKKDGTTLYHIAEGLRTHSTMNFQYGYLEMRVKTPIQGGIGTAFWLTGLCGPETSTTYNSLTWDDNFKAYCTEIDIIEQYRRTGVFFTTLHKWYPGDGNAYSNNWITHQIDGEYHTYGFKWTPDEMSVYVDGAKCYSYDLSENFDKTGYNTTMDGFRSPHYLRITNDVTTDIEIEGGPELTADVDCTLSVDWIRLYQIPGVGGLWTK